MQNPDANLSQQYSEMTLSGQFHACLFIYFFTKRFCEHKNTHEQTLTNKKKLSKH